MPTMGKYCKAYPIERLREFAGWTENAGNTRKETTSVEGKAVETSRALTADDFLYMQENYVVTDGIFKDENIIFENVTLEWINYCQQVLKFEIPAYELAKPPGAAENT